MTQYRFLLQVASCASLDLLEGRLEQFDSLVGENACQIRAIKIALIASGDLSHFQSLNERATKALTIIESLLEPGQLNLLMNEGCTLMEIFNRHDLNIPLTEDSMYAIQSFVLTEMKDTKEDEEIISSLLSKAKCSSDKLKNKYPEITVAFIDKLSKNLRVQLSKASVDFVRKVAFDLQDASSIKMLGDDFVVEHNFLTCIPTFWSFKTLFTLAQKEKIPMIFHLKFLQNHESGYRTVDEDHIYYKFCSETGKHLETEPSEQDLSLPTCVIQGVMCPKEGSLSCKKTWREKIKNFSVFDMLLAMGADHRQYPNPALDAHIQDPEYMRYKSLAESEGFALENPTTFFTRHIFCSLAKNILPPSKCVEGKFEKLRNSRYEQDSAVSC